MGQFVEHGHPCRTETAIATAQQRPDVMRADEPGAASCQNSHELICTLLWSPRISRCALGTLSAGVSCGHDPGDREAGPAPTGAAWLSVNVASQVSTPIICQSRK